MTEATVTSVIQVLEQILLHGVLMKCPYHLVPEYWLNIWIL
jgi:hypothetical protein